jgi:hypothetical protein
MRETERERMGWGERKNAKKKNDNFFEISS